MIIMSVIVLIKLIASTILHSHGINTNNTTNTNTSESTVRDKTIISNRIH